MTGFNILLPIITRFHSKALSILILATVLATANTESSSADPNSASVIVNSDLVERTVQGRTGGSNDTRGCGFVSNNPVYEMNLETRIDYMRFTVKANGGQPTLLVIGPSSGDSFCVLGDRLSGLRPEISGVWEAGYYQIYVGDRTGSSHQFTLNISTNN